ncbi:MAG: amino acid ABC transporter substrate-binding protein [Campylobacteraceae bacterium]|nr:amino acid ABC transporter substrate-binding protein [Campylobacteraceae bacterium]
MAKVLYLFLMCFFFLSQTLVAKHQEIIVATDSWPPFRIHKDNHMTGIDFDIWAEIGKRLDLKITFRKFPWSRILHNLETGEVDAMSGLAKTEARAKYMTYVTPQYYTCSAVFYLKKGEGHLIKTYEDLYKYPIAYVSNSAYFEKFDNDKKLKKHPIYSEIQLLKMLKNNRIKVIIGTNCQIDYEIEKLGLTSSFEKAYYKPSNSSDLYFAISKKSPFIKDLNKINKVIQDMIDEGKIKEIARKYYK